MEACGKCKTRPDAVDDAHGVRQGVGGFSNGQRQDKQQHDAERAYDRPGLLARSWVAAGACPSTDGHRAAREPHPSRHAGQPLSAETRDRWTDPEQVDERRRDPNRSHEPSEQQELLVASNLIREWPRGKQALGVERPGAALGRSPLHVQVVAAATLHVVHAQAMQAGIERNPLGRRIHAGFGAPLEHELVVDPHGNGIVRASVHIDLQVLGHVPETIPSNLEESPRELGVVQKCEIDVGGGSCEQGGVLVVDTQLDRLYQSGLGLQPLIEDTGQPRESEARDQIDRDDYCRLSGHVTRPSATCEMVPRERQDPHFRRTVPREASIRRCRRRGRLRSSPWCHK